MDKKTTRIAINTIDYYKNKKTARELEEVPIDILRCMYLDLLNNVEQLEKVIEEMEKYMIQEFAEYQLDDIYAELYNCNGMERNWTRGDEEELKDIRKYFRKKCE